MNLCINKRVEDDSRTYLPHFHVTLDQQQSSLLTDDWLDVCAGIADVVLESAQVLRIEVEERWMHDG